MRNLILIIFLLHAVNICSAQDFEYSVGFHLQPSMFSFNLGIGADAGVEYLLSDNYSLLTNLSVNHSEMKRDVGYLRSRFANIIAIEEIFKFKNIEGAERLIFGIGVGYYKLNTNKIGHSPLDDDGERISGADWVTYGGLNSMIGLSIPFSDSFGLNLGVKYYLIPTWTEGKIFDFSTNDYKYKEEFVWLSGLQISLTFVFK